MRHSSMYLCQAIITLLPTLGAHTGGFITVSENRGKVRPAGANNQNATRARTARQPATTNYYYYYEFRDDVCTRYTVVFARGAVCIYD